MVQVIYSAAFLDHQTGAQHPERPERVTVCAEALRSAPFKDQIHWLEPRLATRLELEMVHSSDYLDRVEQLAHNGGGMLDADTPVSPQSYEIARLSAGAWLIGVDQALAGARAFALARPPGHHARPDQGMGFCLLSNAALAAHYALGQGLKRVAVLDWDVHHGNGTQEILEVDPRLAYCSIHQSPCYPGTGFAQETGHHQNVLNIPLPAGSTGAEYRAVFAAQVIPFMQGFQPELLILSAGFDAHRQDPLAQMNLEAKDYAALTRLCLPLAPRILVGLEGGYDLDALQESVVSVIEVLLFKRL